MSPADASWIQDMLDFEINQGTRGCVERTDTDHLPSSIPLGDCNPCEGPLVLAATVRENGRIEQKHCIIKDTSNFCNIPGNHDVSFSYKSTSNKCVLQVAIGVGVGALIVAVAGCGYLIYK